MGRLFCCSFPRHPMASALSLQMSGRLALLVLGSTQPGGVIMNTSQELIETYLDDLQSEMEAGGRQVDRMRAALLDKQLKQAALMGELVRRVEGLRASVSQQRETLRALRAEMQARRRQELK